MKSTLNELNTVLILLRVLSFSFSSTSRGSVSRFLLNHKPPNPGNAKCLRLISFADLSTNKLVFARSVVITRWT